MSKQRPNIVGKGPTLTREIIRIFEEIQKINGALSVETAEKINAGLAERAEALSKIVKMAYLKTVKAGETAWDLKEEAEKLKSHIESGDEAQALETYHALTVGVDDFIKKIKSFVVRMT